MGRTDIVAAPLALMPAPIAAQAGAIAASGRGTLSPNELRHIIEGLLG